MCNFKILKKQEASDGTKKYLFDVLDGNAIESVLMEYHHGKTICVSSQIGCKMGCKFCASPGIKFIRSLTCGEIVEQVLAVEQNIGDKISNIVFMGIGEPFDNYDNVMKAIKIINNQKGLNIGARHISISTSGLVPMIYKFADEELQCTLSISLHATTDEKRSSMMPINNRYNIKELMEACKYYINKTNKRNKVGIKHKTRRNWNLCHFNRTTSSPQAIKAKGNKTAPNPKYCHSRSAQIAPIPPRAFFGKLPLAVFQEGSVESYVAKATAKAIPVTIKNRPHTRMPSLWKKTLKESGKNVCFSVLIMTIRKQKKNLLLLCHEKVKAPFNLCVLGNSYPATAIKYHRIFAFPRIPTKLVFQPA